MVLSLDQERALSMLMDWVKSSKKNQFITLGGYAGTGKTTLIAKFRQEYKRESPKSKVAFAAFTGKATRVLKEKLLESGGVEKDDSVSTIHSLIYSPISNDKKEIIGWKRKEELENNLIIIDEASMVDKNIWDDLLSYRLPIVAVGDHGQLPPINGEFNLMEKPEIRLEEIHRQAKDNPIIEIATIARKEGQIKITHYGKGVVKLDRNSIEAQEEIGEQLSNFKKEMLVLCGYNQTRVRLNSHIRSSLGFETPNPREGDRVICLRNNHKKGIYNGMLGTIQEILKKDANWYETTIEMDGETDLYQGLILERQFNNRESLNFTEKRVLTIKGDLFDFGYALTVHKAQGSQAKKVILFEERFPQMSDDQWKRWLYTGITRAEEELYIIGS